MNQQFYKNMALWVVVLVTMLLLLSIFKQDPAPPPEVAYSEFLTNVDDGAVQDVVIEEGLIKGHLNDGTEFTTYHYFKIFLFFFFIIKSNFHTGRNN